MGLSTKQVSSDGIAWGSTTLLDTSPLDLPKPPSPQPPPISRRRQQQNNQAEQLKCPRCDSTNTKFCYYNNYNKSQPRHYCKSCKRHWTKGGTLRNVPIGGGRKNKRLKTSSSSTTTTTTAAINPITTTVTHTNQTNIVSADVVYQALIRQPMNASEFDMQNLSSSFNGVFLNSSFEFPYTSLSSFETNPSSISTFFQSSTAYNLEMESSALHQPWQEQSEQSTSYWNWEDINTIFSASDLTLPWDDESKETR